MGESPAALLLIFSGNSTVEVKKPKRFRVCSTKRLILCFNKIKIKERKKYFIFVYWGTVFYYHYYFLVLFIITAAIITAGCAFTGDERYEWVTQLLVIIPMQFSLISVIQSHVRVIRAPDRNRRVASASASSS